MIAQEPVETTDLEQVEQVLREARAGDRQGSVRATTLNLVIHAGDPEHIVRATQALARIGGSRPLRAIITSPSGDGPRATVSSSCWLAAERRQVCSEQVLIEAPLDALPSAVVPLLVPDLPVFLLWCGQFDPLARVLQEMAELATRLIVDSDEAGLDAVGAVASLPPPLADLAWTRLTSWREALAALADGAAGRKALSHLVGVEAEGPENQGRLLTGWLRSRLARQVGFDQVKRLKRLERVSLLCGHEELVVARIGRGQLGTVCGPGVPEHTVVLASPPWAALLASELDRLGSDSVFEEALAAAVAG
ncbi:MAG: glucose-6-phosphate dehydrogenase assembly protein OpcA [Gaiellales bacterium]